MNKNRPTASVGFELSAITEASAGVLGNEIKKLESYQDFTNKGTAVLGGTAAARIWTDKSYVPITLKTQCIDCLHCVVACPHHAIGYDIQKQESSGLVKSVKSMLNSIPGFHFDDATNHEIVHKSDTNYNHCKGCFVCASACPVDAIHFVPKDFVNYEKFKGAPVEPEQVKEIFLPPSEESSGIVDQLIKKAEEVKVDFDDSANFAPPTIINGSTMLGEFTMQAQFDIATMFPITPNTGLLKELENKQKALNAMGDYSFKLRTCLSEESGYAWLTGAVAKGKRALMAQGSQSMAQLYEHMNINPGLHLPVFMLELTRAIAPGTSIKPDHTTTLRTADTGEIILFGRGVKDNYLKAVLLLKLMEHKSTWIPGRLVIKGFVETHALSTQKQVDFELLSDETIRQFLGRPKNPFILDDQETRSVGILDFDARYGEQRQAIDQVLINAGNIFDEISQELSAISKSKAIQKVDRYPEQGEMDLCIISLNDPDLNTAEYVADKLNNQGLKCGVVSINLYRPFPAEEIRKAVQNTKAIAILEYSNRSGRGGGAQLGDEVRSALYSLKNPPPLFSVQVGLGGRAVTIPYILLIYRMLADLATGNPNAKTILWLNEHARDKVISLGNRGNTFPDTDASFDIPIAQENIEQIVIVGKGGQGVLLLNGLLSAVAGIQNKCSVSMVGYGALQRGGGITLSFKYGEEKIRDYSDIIITDTLVSFEDDIHLEAMLPQLKDGGTLIIDAEPNRLQDLQNKVSEDTKVVILPAKALAIKLYNNSTRTNLILFGAILANMGLSVEDVKVLANKLQFCESISKEASILKKPLGLKGLFSGYFAFQAATGNLPKENLPSADKSLIETLDSFQKRILPDNLYQALTNENKLKSVKKKYQFKKNLYQLMFKFHPMVSQIQSMYLKLRGKAPISGGDMACGGCGQINIFRNVFNFLYALQNEKGKIFISEQDGCGTVFSGMNRTSIWNMPYIRIAFETAHGVASGLTEDLTDDDIVVSISGDGGMMQGIRSVEDALHHQDPILHLVVVNQTLGNTGGQSTATTMVGTKTREGHIAKQNSVNFLKFAEKHHVQGAFASTVNLSDLYKKLRWAHRVVKKQRSPFLLIMNFSCLEQGMNLAKSLILQKAGMDAHFFNLYTLDYKIIRNNSGQILYFKKLLTINHYPWVFGKKAWKEKLLEYSKSQAILSDLVDDPNKLESAYGQIRGQWEELKNDMGLMRYYWHFFLNAFSLSRITMKRIIRKTIPKEAE